MGNRFSGNLEGVDFQGLHGSQGQYTIRLMALYIPHRCPKCFESVTLIQPQHNGRVETQSVMPAKVVFLRG